MYTRPIPGLLLVLVASAATAEEAPRDVVARAVKALGGEAALTRPKVTFSRLRGVMHNLDGAPFTGTTHSAPGDRFRQTMLIEVNGTPVNYVNVHNGPDAWLSVNGVTETMDDTAKAAMQKARHADRVLTLVPLLKDKAFTLTALGEAQVEGKACLGVKVSHPDQPDVTLQFDKQTGLLHQSTYRAPDENTGEETARTLVFGDYRELNSVKEDEQTLAKAKVATDAPGLLTYFRKRTLTPQDAGRLRGLARQLGSDSFKDREQAATDLVAAGPSALPFLRHAAKDPDPEVSRRAKGCLDQIKAEDVALAGAAARLLADRKPAEAVEVLLGYVPFAPDDAVRRDALATLMALARRDGKPEPALVRAAEDPDPVRKAAALAALGRDGGAFAAEPNRRLPVTGVLVPRKVTSYRGGKKAMEWEKVEIHYYNGFDEGVFAKP